MKKTRSKKSRDTVPLTATQVGDGLLTPTHHSVWPYWIHREQCDGEIVSFSVQVTQLLSKGCSGPLVYIFIIYLIIDVELSERLTADAKSRNSSGFDPNILRHSGI